MSLITNGVHNPSVYVINTINHVVNLDLLTEDSVIIDAGSNVGFFVEKMQQLMKETKGFDLDLKIYAIEPGDYQCDVIKSKKFKNVELLQSALVGTKTEKTLFYEYLHKSLKSTHKEMGEHPKYHQWGNVLGDHYDRFSSDKNIDVTIHEVESLTLPELIQSKNIKSIGYLKMDIEGVEYDVIEQMTQKEADIINQISLEPHDPSKNAALVAKLTSLGYIVKETRMNEIYAYKKVI